MSDDPAYQAWLAIYEKARENLDYVKTRKDLVEFYEESCSSGKVKGDEGYKRNDRAGLFDTLVFLHVQSVLLGKTCHILSDKLVELEQRLASHRSNSYRGVFSDTVTYEPGDLVTFGGSLWHCNSLTKSRPGEGASEWTLAVKRGRDGKDAR